MDTDVFSPIRNVDEQKIKRQSDGFSEFLKGPSTFKKKSMMSKTVENSDENIPVNSISNIKSSKTRPKKTAKCDLSETSKSKEALATTALIQNCEFADSPEISCSFKKDKSGSSKKNHRLRPNEQNETECNDTQKHNSHSAKKNSTNVIKSSLQSGATVVPIASGSKEIKKAEPSSVSQRNPLSQIQSGVLEKIINDAVESQVDVIRQSLWSHHLHLLKAIHKIEDEMEQRRAENTTLFKIIEQLLNENCVLRDAVLARQ